MTGAVAATCGAARDVAPDAVNWANIGPGDSPQANADQTMTGFSGSITLVATLSAGTYGAGAKTFVVYKNSVAGESVTPSNGATVSATVVSGDTIHYHATKGTPGSGTSWDGTATVTVTENGGATLDTFTVNVNAAP